MKPLSALAPADVSSLVGVAFDLDDTVLDRGRLGEAAYGALFRLREAGLCAIVATGRPASWGEVIARQWPVDAAIVENGALAFVWSGERIERVDLGRGVAEPERRASLLSLARGLCERHPAAALADDNAGRVTDVTIDVAEHRRVPLAEIEAMRAEAEDQGARTTLSSVHLHLAAATHDKATGIASLLCRRFDEDATALRRRWAFVGDSENDGSAFAAFATTFGPANVRDRVRRMSIPPRFVAPSPMGRGFAEIVAAIVRCRAAGV